MASMSTLSLRFQVCALACLDYVLTAVCVCVRVCIRVRIPASFVVLCLFTFLRPSSLYTATEYLDL